MNFEETPSQSHSHCLNVFMFVLLLVLLTFFSVDLFTTHYSITLVEYIFDYLANLDLFLSTFAIIFAVALSVITLFPTMILTLAGGYFYSSIFGFYVGVPVATLVNVIGNTIGCVGSLYIAREFFRGELVDIESKFPFLTGIEKALQKKGLQINILLRLSPILPSVLLNYGLPMVGTLESDFLIGCFFGNIPWSLFLSFIGALLSNFQAVISFCEDAPLWMVVTSAVVGVIFLALSIILLYVYSSGSMEEALKGDEEDQHETTDGEEETGKLLKETVEVEEEVLGDSLPSSQSDALSIYPPIYLRKPKVNGDANLSRPIETDFNSPMTLSNSPPSFDPRPSSSSSYGTLPQTKTRG